MAKISIRKYLKNKYTIAIIVMRLSGYAVIPFYPLEGMILSIIFDYADWMIMTVSDLPKALYHRLDKIIDYIQYIVLIPVLYNTEIFPLYMIFLVWRTVGHILFEKYNNKKLFFIFPNMAEYLALLYFLNLRFNWNLNVQSVEVLLMLLVFKLVTEYILHFKSTGSSYEKVHRLKEKLLLKHRK
jgi:hypothetical protein